MAEAPDAEGRRMISMLRRYRREAAVSLVYPAAVGVLPFAFTVPYWTASLAMTIGAALTIIMGRIVERRLDPDIPDTVFADLAEIAEITGLFGDRIVKDITVTEGDENTGVIIINIISTDPRGGTDSIIRFYWKPWDDPDLLAVFRGWAEEAVKREDWPFRSKAVQ